MISWFVVSYIYIYIYQKMFWWLSQSYDFLSQEIIINEGSNPYGSMSFTRRERPQNHTPKKTLSEEILGSIGNDIKQPDYCDS
jgi:hypothetical protein